MIGREAPMVGRRASGVPFPAHAEPLPPNMQIWQACLFPHMLSPAPKYANLAGVPLLPLADAPPGRRHPADGRTRPRQAAAPLHARPPGEHHGAGAAGAPPSHPLAKWPGRRLCRTSSPTRRTPARARTPRWGGPKRSDRFALTQSPMAPPHPTHDRRCRTRAPTRGWSHRSHVTPRRTPT